MDIGQWIVIVLSVVMGVWFMIGSVVNRRRGVETYKWFQKQLEPLGKITESRWIGTSGSGARMVVGKPARPYQRVEVVFLLDSREILPLWAFNLLRGKQDEMVLKANLRTAPGEEVEVRRARGRAFPRQTPEAPPQETAVDGGFEVTRRGKGKPFSPGQLEGFLREYGEAILSISVKKQMPHLIVRASLPPLRAEEASGFFLALQAWLEEPSS